MPRGGTGIGRWECQTQNLLESSLRTFLTWPVPADRGSMGVVVLGFGALCFLPPGASEKGRGDAVCSFLVLPTPSGPSFFS